MKTKIKVRELKFEKDARIEHETGKVYFSLRILFDDFSSEYLKTDDIFEVRAIIEKYLFVDKPYNEAKDAD